MLDVRQEAILQAASQLLCQKTFAAMTMDDVAAAVGIAKASLYKHFSSKDELCCAAVVQMLGQVRAHLASLPAQAAPLEKLRAAVSWSLQRLLAQELPGIVADFAQAARHARQCGFDGVEIHGANGYLPDQFLKDGSNQRDDAWGGSIENRVRLVCEVVQAVTAAIGAGRVGLRISPVSPANGIHDSAPQPLFEHLLRCLAPLGLAYIHVIEGATGGPRSLPEQPFDYAALKAAYRSAGGQGLWMVNNGYTREMALEAVASGYADMVAWGKDFIANPDLVERLRRDAPLNPGRRELYYGGGAEGYTDYPRLAD